MTVIQFQPASTANFQFSPVLDGITYVAICTYNNYSPRYYISIFDTNNNLVINRPIIASPDDYDINIIQGYFKTSKLVYRASNRSFIITP